jgi:hypothetical protein
VTLRQFATRARPGSALWCDRRQRRFAALHFAAQTGDAELVAALLAARADVHSKDVSGYERRTPRCNAGQLQRRANAPQRGPSGA